MLTDKLEQHDHAKCPDTIYSFRQLGMACTLYTENIEYTIYFLEMIGNLYLYSPEAIQAATDSHVLVTLCSAYGDAERADEGHQLCEASFRTKL